MRFTNDILEKGFWAMTFGESCDQLGGMKKLIAKGENGTFWASDFGIKGSEMVGLSYLSVIKDTGVRKEVEFAVERWNGDKIIKKGQVIQWELTDYERLKRAYELIVELINL